MLHRLLTVVTLPGLLAASIFSLADETPSSNGSVALIEIEPTITAATSIEEARGRAFLIYEMANGSLQVMHRDYFDEENLHAIPSASLEDVFIELNKSFRVEMKWLNTGTDVMNTDHAAKDEFELKAAKAIQQGKKFVEAFDLKEYRFAGAVPLRSQCLKCHVKDRKSSDDRFAGIVIRMGLDTTAK